MDISFSGVTFKNNGVLASGILGVKASSMARVASYGAGGVTTKSISKNIRAGHNTPVVQIFEQGIINAVGLSSLGIEKSNDELKYLRSITTAIIIASVFGGTAEEFRETVEELDNNSVDIIELNISCPNVANEFGTPFCCDPKTASDVVKKVRDVTKKVLLVKLSPNYPNIGSIARACEDVGADGITAINSVGPGMLVDINTFRPKLTNKSGGLSGPAILPIAIRSVYDIYKSVTIPIIGIGGITKVEDAIQMIAVGATLYGVGSGIFFNGIDIFKKINDGIDIFLKDKDMKYKDLVGIVHNI